MGKNRVISGLSAALLLASGGIAQAGSGSTVQGATVVDSAGRTRALIEVSGDPQLGVFTLANPDRLVLDLHKSRFDSGFRVPGPDGVVANVRTGQPVPGDARLVFDLSAPVHPQTHIEHRDGHSEIAIELLTGSQHASSESAKPAPAATLASESPATIRKTANNPVVDNGIESVASATNDSGDNANTQTQAPIEPYRDTIRHGSSNTSVNAGATADAAPAAAMSIATTSATEVPDSAMHPGRTGARTLRDVLGAGQRKLVIAIDAGHGGQDVGAKGYTGTYEKNVTLATARELARQVNTEPGMQAVLIRDGDYFIPLTERYRKARAAKADLFISIHADADPTHSATGSSVWVLSQRGVTSQAARWLADRENAADLVGGVKLSDKDDTLASVLLDLSQSATMKASNDAAERVHQALRDIGRTHKAHPEHANFVVLRSPDVPSMLVETAFITNADEEQQLNDPDYRARLAGAVLAGVRGYFIDNPLPGTQFAALHDAGSRDRHVVASASAESDAGMVQTAYESDDSDSSARPIQLASAADVPQYHIVRRGERLIDIANQYGVTVMQLRELNDLDSSRIRTGQRLRIPQRSGQG